MKLEQNKQSKSDRLSNVPHVEQRGFHSQCSKLGGGVSRDIAWDHEKAAHQNILLGQKPQIESNDCNRIALPMRCLLNWTFKWTSFDCKTSNFSAVRFEVLNLAKWATTIGKTNAKRHPSMQSIRGFFIGLATSCGNSSQSKRWGGHNRKASKHFSWKICEKKVGCYHLGQNRAVS